MSKITVVHILRSPQGGIRKHVVDIIENLPAHSYRKIFVTNLSEADRDLHFLNDIHGVEFLDLSIKDTPELKDISNIVKIYFFLKSKENVILHGHGAKGGVYSRICSFILRCPCFYTPHGGSLHRMFSKTKSLIYDTIEKMLIPLTDKFIFESKYSALEFRRYVGNCSGKEVINYNGVSFDVSCKTSQYQKGQTIIMASLGLLRNLKGHDIVVDALNIVSQEGIDFIYTIYGYGPEYENLMEKINSLELQDKIKIESYSNDILEIMHNCDLVIHPSRFESFGYVPVEAMSVKVPVVTSNEGGLKEVTVDGGSFLALNNTAEEYAAIVRDFYHGRYNLEKMTEHAYEVSRARFSIQKMVSNLDLQYRRFPPKTRNL